MRKLVITLALFMLISLLLIACKEQELPSHDETQESESQETETEGQETNKETESSFEMDPILSELNGDGVEDKILIEFENGGKTTATIKVLSGTDNTEWMAESLTLDTGKVGAYYLKVGKQIYPDELVMWQYSYLDNGKLAFQCSAFTFEPNGKKLYHMQESKVFDISPSASLASGNIPFGAMIEILNKNIRANDTEYNAYLLLDNQGEEMLVSTKDHLLSPAALAFTLEHFAHQGEDTSPDSGSSDQGDRPQASLEIAIEEGYTIISQSTLTLPVTIDKGKINHTARVAALRNAAGENALYLDVLSEDNTVITSITWKGCYQLFVNDEGLLILMRVLILPERQKGTAVCQLYEISDTKISGYDIVELDSPQINTVAGEGQSLSFAVGSDAAVAMYEYHFLDFANRFQDELISEIKDGHEVYMIAECYLNAEVPTVYSDTQKIPLPNFESKEISDKYTMTYAASLFEGKTDVKTDTSLPGGVVSNPSTLEPSHVTLIHEEGSPRAPRSTTAVYNGCSSSSGRDYELEKVMTQITGAADTSNIYINKDKLDSSEKNALPLTAINSIADLEIMKSLSSSQAWKNLAANYDEAFFETKTLFVVSFSASSGSYRYSVDRAITVNDTELCFTITHHALPPETMVTSDMKYWVFLFEIDREDIAHCTDFDAKMVVDPA